MTYTLLAQPSFGAILNLSSAGFWRQWQVQSVAIKLSATLMRAQAHSDFATEIDNAAAIAPADRSIRQCAKAQGELRNSFRAAG